MDGELADVAAGEKKRADDIGIGGKSQARSRPRNRQNGGIVHPVKQRVGKGRRDDAFNQVVHGLAAAAVAGCNGLLAEVEFPLAHLAHFLDLFQRLVHCLRFE